MLAGISGLGGAGGVGSGGQYSSSATAKNDSTTNAGSTGSAGGGNRGFINNFAAAGASQTNDQGINPPIASGKSYATLLWVIGGAGALILLLMIAKRFVKP